MFVKALKDFTFEIEKGKNIVAKEGDVLKVPAIVFDKLIKRLFCSECEEPSNVEEEPKKSEKKSGKKGKKMDKTKLENKADFDESDEEDDN